MPKKTFVSYNYSDSKLARTVRSHFNDKGGPVQGKPVSVEQNVSAGGSEKIDEAINQAISSCDQAVFVVGDNAHNSEWIGREARLAVSKGIPVTVAQLPGTTGGIPNELKSIPHNKVDFSSTQIAKAINHSPSQRKPNS